ncbi:hypothetical protein [Fodinibius salinus]|nr:hypothetical protein [Fodinibius salinus]
MYKILTLALLALSMLFSSCGINTSGNINKEVTFEFQTTGDEHFFAQTTDQELIKRVRQQLSLPQSERDLFINGTIARGQEANNGWSWHFISNEWELTEAAIEVCDGRPSMVEQNIDYWVDDVGRFCPYSSFVVREVSSN